MDFSSVKSSMPWCPHSRPTPLCLKPPKTPVMPTPLGSSGPQPGPVPPSTPWLDTLASTVCTATLPARICRPGYRGCSFLNAATEFPEAGHLGRQAALKHYAELRRRLLALCRGVKARKPKQLADQLLLLIEGAYTTGGILGYRDAVRSVSAAASELIGKRQPARGNR